MAVGEYGGERDPREVREPWFDAVLYAHPSLSPRGFLLFMAALCLIGFTTGTLFLIAGAWPVMGFFGLDVLLVYIAFRINYRRQRMFETLLLTDEALLVERVRPGRRTERWRFQPYWLRVVIDDAPRRVSALNLKSHGNTLEIGAFLTAGEKLDVARALREALGRLHGRAG